MGSNVISAIIGVVGTLIGAAVGGFASYKGAIKATKEQLKFQYKQVEIQEENNRKLTKEIIERCLWTEIQSNYYRLGMRAGEKGDFFALVVEKTEQLQWSYNPFSFSYLEYNTFRLELLKYSKGIVDKIVEFYNVLKIIEKYSDLNQYSPEDFKRVQQIQTLYHQIENEISIT